MHNVAVTTFSQLRSQHLHFEWLRFFPKTVDEHWYLVLFQRIEFILWEVLFILQVGRKKMRTKLLKIYQIAFLLQVVGNIQRKVKPAGSLLLDGLYSSLADRSARLHMKVFLGLKNIRLQGAENLFDVTRPSVSVIVVMVMYRTQ